jgi:flagellar basal body-associated protein FliL
MKKRIIIIILVILAIAVGIWWAFSATQPNTPSPERDTAAARNLA